MYIGTAAAASVCHRVRACAPQHRRRTTTTTLGQTENLKTVAAYTRARRRPLGFLNAARQLPPPPTPLKAPPAPLFSSQCYTVASTMTNGRAPHPHAHDIPPPQSSIYVIPIHQWHPIVVVVKSTRRASIRKWGDLHNSSPDGGGRRRRGPVAEERPEYRPTLKCVRPTQRKKASDNFTPGVFDGFPLRFPF